METTVAATQPLRESRELELAQLPREMREQARATWEKNDREYAEILKRSEPQEIANRRAVTAFDPAASLRAQLAAMTAEERASQAWAGGVALMSEGEPGALHVVRVIPAFLRARGSPANAQAILVVLRAPPPVLVTAQDQLHREFDWQALRKLLDTRP